MFLAKRHVSRRTLLRGAVACVALPFLDAMAPAQTPTRQSPATPRGRVVCIEMVHGAAGSTDEGARLHCWSPAKEGRDFDLSYSLEPLAPFRDSLTIVSGTDAREAEALTPSEGGADHFGQAPYSSRRRMPVRVPRFPTACRSTSFTRNTTFQVRRSKGREREFRQERRVRRNNRRR